MKNYLYLVFSLIVIIAACSSPSDKKFDKRFILKEVYQTERDTSKNIDSPALWNDGNGNALLLATGKTSDDISVYNALNGSYVQSVGSAGNGKLEFERPNGIFVIDSLLFVVERDNKRVQVLSLPEFRFICFIGGQELIRPYGIFVYRPDSTNYRLYITDNYETEDELLPPPSELDERIKMYNLNYSGGLAEASFVKAFGDTSGAGMLRIVESIAGDVENNKLLIAEEDSAYSSVKIYNLDGKFTGKEIPGKYFVGQIEGISLFSSSASENFWIITDQSYEDNSFKIFGRNAYEYIAEFVGPKTSNTDGIWLDNNPLPSFEKGLFLAVHDDGNVSAFDIKSVIDSVKIRRTSVRN